MMKLKSLLIVTLLLTFSACSVTNDEPTPVAELPTLIAPVTAVPTNTTTPTMTPTAPTPTATAVPHSGAPVLITHDNTNVRLGPGTSFSIANVLPPNSAVRIIGKNLDSTWWAISATGQVGNGWVSATAVTTQGDLSGLPFVIAPTLTPTPRSTLPVVGNSGPPPTDICAAAYPGPNDGGPALLRQGAGDAFPAVAELGFNRWAAIIEIDGRWYHIQDQAGTSGWVQHEHVAVTCPSASPSPEQIIFEPGAISVIIDGELLPPERDSYLFRSLAGQRAIIEIHSTNGRANFMLSGVGDGQPYKRLENEDRIWSATLPLEQDYLLTVAAPADAPLTEYSVELLIEPLNTMPPPPEGMEIGEFGVTAVDLPNNGKQLTFNWDTRGGTSARIRSGTAQRFQPIWDVPLAGEMTVDVAQTLFRDPVITLELYNAAGEFIVESVIVDWNCTHAYFFTPEPRRCPHPATAVSAAIQAFERGQMVWLENVNSDGQNHIFVLFNDGRLQAFTDTWQEGDPVDDPALEPPPGLFQPVRGFGKVWREQPGVREQLGWATSGEQMFQATLQAEIGESIPTQVYLQLLDGRILYLPLDVPVGSWEQIK